MPSNGELSVLGIIKSVLPDGTRRRNSWTSVCDWAPDLFAAMATITERSGLYAEASFMAYWTTGFALSKAWIDDTCSIGKEWATSASPPKAVVSFWSDLIQKHGNALIADTTSGSLEWKKIVFQLLAIADEACAGIGFPPAGSSASERRRRTVTGIQYLVAEDYIAWEEKRRRTPEIPVMGGDLLPYLPHSLCMRVPPVIACVQPKTSTPGVGCTLRSLTHHVALLPSIANVSTRWQLANEGHQDLEAFNFLIVPFPFVIPGRSFTKVFGAFPGGPNERAFTLNPDVWIGSATPQDFADFLLGLVKAAQPELEPVHAIVMPETALRLGFAS